MRRFLVIPLLLAVVLPFAVVLFAQEKPRPPRKVALLVGPKQYLHDFSALPHLDDDVTALAAELRKGGFDEVVVLTDSPEGKNPATKENILAHLDRLLSGGGDKSKAIRKDDVVLIGLSGHGLEIFLDGKTKDTFFAPIDGKKKEPKTLLNVGEVLDKVGGCGCRTLVLADMCRDIFDPNKGKGLDTDNLKLPKNAAVLFGCESTQQSFVNTDLKHSLFTYAVLEVMKEANTRGEPLLWSELVSGVEKKFGSDQFKKLMGDDRQQSPVPRVADLKATTLLAAVSNTTDTGEKTEEFTWKGEKRKRTVRTVVLGGEKVEFVKVPAGSFVMGSPDSDKDADKDEKPQHTVKFTKPLWVAKYPVTKGQFAAFTKAAKYETEAEGDGKGGYGYGTKFEQSKDYSWKNTGWTQTDNHPVVNVTWNDAEAYCKWAAKESKTGIRLLNESEYEYANRGGSKTVYITGDDIASLEGYANVSDKSAKAKFPDWTAAPFDDGYVFTSPVGKFKPNGFGLFDMTGNVWSWCGDWYDAKLYERGSVTDPKAHPGSEQKYRVLRGGSWLDNPLNCRAAYRIYDAPGDRLYYLGFRVCVALD